jgi:protein tyrosine/serine phosphatase
MEGLMNKSALLRKITFYTLATIVVLGLSVAAVMKWYPNFYTVIPNQVYRSAELTQSQHQHYFNQYRYKSILHLESANNSKAWYKIEKAMVKKHHLQYYALPMDAHGLPTRTELKQLINIIQTSPKPLLIHCKQGADRTGLGSMLSVLFLTGHPYDIAKKQVSLKYGVSSSTSTGVIVIEHFEKWLKQNNLAASRETFQTWVNQLNGISK